MINIYPYIRGTDKRYGADGNGGFWGENGFNCIEAGYLEMDDDGHTIKEVHPIITCADVVGIGEILGAMPRNVNMDCIGEGYLRLFTRDVRDTSLRWESEHIPLSEMRLIEGMPNLFINKEKAK